MSCWPDYRLDESSMAAAIVTAPAAWVQLSASPRNDTESATPTMISISSSVADWAALIEDRPLVYIATATTVQGTPSQMTDSQAAGASIEPNETPPEIIARGAVIMAMDTMRAKELASEDIPNFFPRTMKDVFPSAAPISNKSPKVVPVT